MAAFTWANIILEHSGATRTWGRRHSCVFLRRHQGKWAGAPVTSHTHRDDLALSLICSYCFQNHSSFINNESPKGHGEPRGLRTKRSSSRSEFDKWLSNLGCFPGEMRPSRQVTQAGAHLGLELWGEASGINPGTSENTGLKDTNLSNSGERLWDCRGPPRKGYQQRTKASSTWDLTIYRKAGKTTEKGSWGRQSGAHKTLEDTETKYSNGPWPDHRQKALTPNLRDLSRKLAPSLYLAQYGRPL